MSFWGKAGRILSAPVRLPLQAARAAESHAMSSIIQGLIRHGLTTLGGALVAHGYLGQSDVATAVGAVMTLVGVAWSVIEKRLRTA